MPGDQFAQREAELNEKLERFEDAGDAEGVKRVNAKLAKLADKRAAAVQKGEAKSAHKSVKGSGRGRKRA